MAKKSMALLRGWFDPRTLLRVGVALVMLALGHAVGKWAEASLNARVASGSPRQNQEQARLGTAVVANMAYLLVMLGVIVAAFKTVGVEVMGVVTGLGLIGVMLGIATQGILSDVSSGIILAIMQTYAIGDVIEVDGTVGRVAGFNLFYTTVDDTYARTSISIPNRRVQENAVVNHTRHQRRFLVTDVLVSNKTTDFDRIARTLAADVPKHPKVDPSGGPVRVGVFDMGNVGTKMRVRTPVLAADYGPDLVMSLHLHIRSILARLGVELVDPF